MTVFGHIILLLCIVTWVKNRILGIWNAVFLCFREKSKIEPGKFKKRKTCSFVVEMFHVKHDQFFDELRGCDVLQFGCVGSGT